MKDDFMSFVDVVVIDRTFKNADNLSLLLPLLPSVVPGAVEIVAVVLTVLGGGGSRTLGSSEDNDGCCERIGV